MSSAPRTCRRLLHLHSRRPTTSTSPSSLSNIPLTSLLLPQPPPSSSSSSTTLHLHFRRPASSKARRLAREKLPKPIKRQHITHVPDGLDPGTDIPLDTDPALETDPVLDGEDLDSELDFDAEIDPLPAASSSSSTTTTSTPIITSTPHPQLWRPLPVHHLQPTSPSTSTPPESSPPDSDSPTSTTTTTTTAPELTQHDRDMAEHFALLAAEARDSPAWKEAIHAATNLPIPPRSRSSPLPLPPILSNPDRFMKYSKRHPKERFKPGPARLDERGEMLKENPYAHILASPIRLSQPYSARLPSFLLLSFSLLRAPDPTAPILTDPASPSSTTPPPTPPLITAFLPTSLLPSTLSRPTTGKSAYVELAHRTIYQLKKKTLWKRLLPHPSPNSPHPLPPHLNPAKILWRDDMSEFILSSLRKRVRFEAERMHSVLPNHSVHPVDIRGRILLPDGGLMFKGKARDYNSPTRERREYSPTVGCILKWLDDPAVDGKLVTDPALRTPHDPEEWLPVRKGKLHKLPSQVTVPVHDINLLMGRVEAARLKELFGLPKETKEAAIVMHHQTYKTQMWLMKLRYYFS